MTRIKKVILILLFGALTIIAGCSKYEPEISKPGYGRDALKKSECACIPVYSKGQFLS
jgi:hypothetical protein